MVYVLLTLHALFNVKHVHIINANNVIKDILWIPFTDVILVEMVVRLAI